MKEDLFRDDPHRKKVLEAIHSGLAKAPQLLGPLEDFSIPEIHQNLVPILMG